MKQLRAEQYITETDGDTRDVIERGALDVLFTVLRQRNFRRLGPTISSPENSMTIGTILFPLVLNGVI